VVKKYLWQDRHGHWRVRIKGKTWPLRDARGVWLQPDTPDFDRIYWEILGGKAHEPATSWRTLIDSYRQSDRWARLKPRTRADYEKVLLYIEEKAGKRDAAHTIRKDVIAAQQANAHRIRFANYIPQVMSVLFEHAIDKGWLTENPAKGVRRLATPKEKKQEHIPWPDWAVEKFRAEAGPLPRLIFEIGVGSVQRPDDWTRLMWSHYDGEMLDLSQGKTGKPLLIPCTTELKAALARAPRRGLFILTRADGRPLPYRRMAQIMLEERKRLGLEAYDLHGLRYRGVMELAWAGCDDGEIASYSGHSSLADGELAEWLRSGLQIRAQEFDSPTRLQIE
jgi:hypothetical protein